MEAIVNRKTFSFTLMLMLLWHSRVDAIMPRPNHAVVVVEENTDFAELMAAKNVPLLRSLINDQNRVPGTAVD
jgi:hypothetical protein